MADSNITVSGLTAAGGINQIALAWNSPVDPNVTGLPYLRFDVTEVWKSNTNNRSLPDFVGETSANSFTHLNVPRGSRFYYWIRPRDRSGLNGEWFPLSPTAGVVGNESNVLDALLQPNGFVRRADGIVEEWGQSVSRNASVLGVMLDGVVDATFQTTFTQIFGVSAIGKYEITPPGSPAAAFLYQMIIVGLHTISTTRMQMKTTLVLPDPNPIESVNNVRVYWRVFGI